MAISLKTASQMHGTADEEATDEEATDEEATDEEATDEDCHILPLTELNAFVCTGLNA